MITIRPAFTDCFKEKEFYPHFFSKDEKMWLWKWFWNCGRLKKKQPGLLDGSRLPGEGERVLADPEARALPQMQPTEARREFFYILILLLKNFRQDESEPEESDAEEWTHHSGGVKQQVWDDIIAFHNYLFNKLDPNPDFEIPKSKSDLFTKKANKNWQRWTKKFEPFENNNNHHELLQVPFKCRHLGFELTCLST